MLIKKSKGDPTTPSAYRVVCMLNTTGKILERTDWRDALRMLEASPTDSTALGKGFLPLFEPSGVADYTGREECI